MSKRRISEEEFKNIWNNTKSSSNKLNNLTEEESQKIYFDIEKKILTNSQIRRSKIRKFYYTAVAASIVLLAIVGVFSNYNGGVAEEPVIAMLDRATGEKDRLHVKLEDGSEIWLNVNSSISYPEHFSTNDRSVHLSGEAYFKVAKDKTRPFKVITDHSVTQVLGTEFNLSSYEGEVIDIVVTEGKVSFASNSDRDKSIILTANQQGTLEPTSASLTKRLDVRTEEYTAWMLDKLEFRDEQLSRVIKILSKRYLTDIELADPSIGNCTITMTVEKQSLEILMEMVSFSIKGDYAFQEDGSILLTSVGCN